MSVFYTKLQSRRWQSQFTQTITAKLNPSILPNANLTQIHQSYKRNLPLLIATSLLSNITQQFIDVAIKPKYPKRWNSITTHYNQISSRDDKFIQLNHQLSHLRDNHDLDKFIAQFGAASFSDYELSTPRFHEITPKLATLINPDPPDKPFIVPEEKLPSAHHQLLTFHYQLLHLRQNLKVSLAPVFDQLRQAIITLAKNHQIDSELVFFLTKKELLHFDKSHILSAQNRYFEHHEDSQLILPANIDHTLPDFTPPTPSKSKSHKIIPLSPGHVSAPILKLTHPLSTIGQSHKFIFYLPDASPRFSHLYPQSLGLIFINGGVTSHGAILAREYRLPAVSLSGTPIKLKNYTPATIDTDTATLSIE